MTLPLPEVPGSAAVRVKVAFDLAANGIGDYFTLDDPEKGVLDGTDFLLAGDVLVDITGRVHEVTTDRGRSKALQKFTAGGATVRLRNRDRIFDPLNPDSPFFGLMVPGKQVVVEVDGAAAYTGVVSEWAAEFELGGGHGASVTASDGFSLLAQHTITGGTAVPQSSGERIAAVLDELGWPEGRRAIATGLAVLGSDVVGDNVTGLAYAQRAEASEPGALFMDKAGLFRFRDRAELSRVTDAAFGGPGIPYTVVGVDYHFDDLWTQVSVTYTGGTAVATSSGGVAQYGLRNLPVDTLLADPSDAQDLADYLLARYSTPTARISQITVAVHALTPSWRALVLGLELGDLISVIAPEGVSAQYLSVDRIAHRVTSGGVVHTVSLALSENLPGFILDDPTWGVLDSSHLSF